MTKEKQQFVHYDPEVDVLGIYIKKGREEECIDVAPNISLELDKNGSVIGVEIVNASKVLSPFLRSLKRQKLGAPA